MSNVELKPRKGGLGRSPNHRRGQRLMQTHEHLTAPCEALSPECREIINLPLPAREGSPFRERIIHSSEIVIKYLP